MNRKNGVILGAIIVVVLVAAIVYMNGNNTPPVNTNTNSSNVNGSLSNSTITGNSVLSKVSMSELAKHSIQSNCWVACKGKVYDITAWLPKHPGSAAAIAPYCGKAKEFEDAFTGQHGTSQVEKLLSEGVYKGDLQ